MPSDVLELRDPDRAVGKAGDDLEPTPHGLDIAAKGAHVHVGPALDLRNARLLRAQPCRQGFLGQPASRSQLLKRHFPEAGSYFEAVASSAHIAENVGEGLEKALLDFDQFAIISLAGTPSGTDAKQVNDVLGIHAERKLEALLDAGFLVAKSGKVFTSQDEFGISDNQVIATEIGHALRFVRDEHIGKQMQHLALHTKGLTRDGQKLAHAVIQEALIKLLEIGQNHKGNIPVFFAAAMGTFTSEGVSK